jgi:hypothetical protein
VGLIISETRPIDPTEVINHHLSLLVIEASPFPHHTVDGELPLLARFPDHLNGSKGMALRAAFLD